MANNGGFSQAPMFLLRLLEGLALDNGLSIDELHQVLPNQDHENMSFNELEVAVEWFLEESQQPWMAMEFAQRTNFQQLELFGPLIASCKTVAEAIDLFQRYLPLLHPQMGFEVEANKQTLCIQYGRYSRTPAKKIYAEIVLGALPVWGERLTGKKVGIHKVWFRQPEPSYAEKYREYFQCEVLFNQDYDALWGDAGFLDMPVLSASPKYHARIKEQASEHLQSMETVSLSIKSIVLSTLPEDVSVEEVSKVLNVSERTLQRKLAEEQTHFKALKQEVRRDEAIRLLETTKFSVEQIAFNLGYEQRSSFSAAFQRWTGVTPAKWRQ
ncbi:hypothetical protein A9Q99_06275 [Gammaproteobacteria bacterium 45_16_T64]|nr:hypothetical protein A9Q99_06275 [Gammaproteobacteria bacterium 45_16_T64]